MDEGVDTYYYGFNSTEIIEIIPSISNISDIYIDIFPIDLKNFDYSICLKYNYGALLHTLGQKYILQVLLFTLCLLLIFTYLQVPNIYIYIYIYLEPGNQPTQNIQKEHSLPHTHNRFPPLSAAS